MFSLIEELWIFSDNGLPLVNFCEDKSINDSLLGGFLSGIKAYCREISGDNLIAFEFENNKFNIIPALKEKVFFVCKCKKSVNSKKLEKLLEVIVKIFEDLYTIEDLKNWNGDLHFFNKFKEKLELYIKLSQL